MAAQTDHSSWLPAEMIVPENYSYVEENYGNLCANIQVYPEGSDPDTPVHLGELIPKSFLKEYRSDSFEDRSADVIKATKMELMGTLHEKFESSKIQTKIYPRGVYMATIDTTGQDVLQGFIEDMEDVGASLLAHIVDAPTGRVDVVILFFHPGHVARAKYCKGKENLVETEVMFLYSDQPVDKWDHSAQRTTLGSQIYLVGEIANVQQPFRDVVLGHQGTLDNNHWRFPILFDHLTDIMFADWEVGYILRQSPWMQSLYAESKKKMAELQSHPDFAKSLESACTRFSRTPESEAAEPSSTIASMDSISRMSAENRRETQSKANREDVRSLYESVFREENENRSNAVFNRRSYVNMLKKSLGKPMGCAVVYDQDAQADKELAALENEAGKALEKLARARARFAFVRGQVPKTRSQSLASTSTSSMSPSSQSSRARRSSKLDEAQHMEASAQRLVTG